TSSNAVEALPSVDGELNYLKLNGAKPRTYTYDPPDGGPRSNLVADPHKIPIRDARGIASNVSIDEEGFGLIHRRSAVTDFYDDGQARQIYYPEAERLLQDVQGRR